VRCALSSPVSVLGVEGVTPPSLCYYSRVDGVCQVVWPTLSTLVAFQLRLAVYSTTGGGVTSEVG
jgi:hypothetical protein